MTECSGTPLPRKLGIREGSLVALLGAPADFKATLGDLPAGVGIGRAGRGPYDLIILFTKRRAQLERELARLAPRLRADGGLWIAWPKKSSGVGTDLDQSAVMEVGLATGLVDDKVAAIDETWSGLRFVVRRENRAAWPPDRTNP
jgi:hypothetical protein